MTTAFARHDPYAHLAIVPTLSLSSRDLADGGPLSWSQTAAGGHLSPHLVWDGVPEGTGSFVVTCFDPDAPTPSGFWHWALVDVPGDVRSLTTGAAGEPLPGDAFHVRNDCSEAGYYGAEPPAGDGPHRYFFSVHAVDRTHLGVTAEATPAAVSFELASATLARGQLIGTHEA